MFNFKFNQARSSIRQRQVHRSKDQPLVVYGLTALLIGATTIAHAAIPASERTVLENIYAQTSGDNWADQRGWNGPPGTECTWSGISCNDAGTTVTGLDLSGRGLYGVLPSLERLTNLESFDVSQTAHSGIGPYNSLFGAIPPLNKLKKLKSFVAGGEFTSGGVPSLAGLSHLEHFECRDCGLTGQITSLSGLTRLKYFYVRNEALVGGLSGTIPPLNGSSRLEYFRVIGNFTGELPDLSGLTQLQTFEVRGYRFSGGLPDLVDLPNLKSFTVRGLVTGHIGTLSNLPNLQDFIVWNNLLTGSIPPLTQLPSLEQFTIAENALTGDVPALSGLSKLNAFSIAYNRLSGSAPAPPQSLIDNAIYPGALCPNLLTPASNPPSKIDIAWNTFTKTTPWSKECVPDPLWNTVTQIRSNLKVSSPGQPITFAAAVYGMDPTGSVTFSAQSDSSGSSPIISLCDKVPLVGQLATCTVSDLPANASTYSIWAEYSGDADNAPSSTTHYAGSTFADLYQFVKDRVSVSTTDNTAQVGQPVDLTLTYSNGTDDDKATFFEGPRSFQGTKFSPGLCSEVPVHKSRSGQYIAHCVTSWATPGPHVVTVATYSSATADPIIQHAVEAKPFDADQFALTGPWYNPATSGQGLQFSVYPDLQGAGISTLVGGWFTFDDAGQQRWLALQGDLSSRHGGSYDLKIARNSGGNFNAGPVTTPAAIIGSAELTFYDCGHAAMTYQFDDGRSGTIPYVRLDPSTACSSTVPATAPSSLPAHYTDVLHSVAWYDPATSGQGLYLDLVPASTSLFGAWFTYAPQGTAGTGVARQRWFTLQDNNYTPGDLDLHDVKIIATTGGKFDEPTPVDVEQVGSADMNFTSCTTMTLKYSFDKGEFKGLSGTINEQVIGGANPACEQ